ncbi:hypothetical protein [Candidatus Vidania fulgoroideorum]
MSYKVYLKKNIYLKLGKKGFFISKYIKKNTTKCGFFFIFFSNFVNNFFGIKKINLTQKGFNNKKKLKAKNGKNKILNFPINTYLKIKKNWYFIKKKIYLIFKKNIFIKVKKIIYKKKIILCEKKYKIKNFFNKKIFDIYKKNFINFLKKSKIIIIIIKNYNELNILKNLSKIKSKIIVFFNNLNINNLKKNIFYIKCNIKKKIIYYYLNKLNI